MMLTKTHKAAAAERARILETHKTLAEVDADATAQADASPEAYQARRLARRAADETSLEDIASSNAAMAIDQQEDPESYATNVADTCSEYGWTGNDVEYALGLFWEAIKNAGYVWEKSDTDVILELGYELRAAKRRIADLEAQLQATTTEEEGS
jgi:hypothetical protein